MSKANQGHLGPNLDFQVNCNISFVLYYKIFWQDLCRSNDTTALVFFFFFFFFFNFWVDTNMKYVISLTLPHLDERHLLNHVPVKFESHLCRFPKFRSSNLLPGAKHFGSNASQNYKQVFICDFHLKRTENA